MKMMIEKTKKTPPALLLTLLLCGPVMSTAFAGQPRGGTDNGEELLTLTTRECILLGMLNPGRTLPPECEQPGSGPPPGDEQAIRDLEEAHRVAALTRDLDAIEEIMAESVVVNTPLNFVLPNRQAVRAALENVFLAAFEKDVELVRIYGDVAVSMGGDTVVPAGGPLAGFMLHRRFTGVYQRVDGRWRMIVRQETIFSQESTEFGQAVDLGDGQLRTFLTTDQSGKPVAFGMEWNASWASLPAGQAPGGGHAHTFLPPMPAGADHIIPFRHVTFDWQPQGHVPPGIYDVPHVDFHFYLISNDERMSITPGACEGQPPLDCETLEMANAPLPPEAQPPFHTVPGGAVPFMGAHLLDPRSDELNGLPFSNTFIFGKFAGALTFFEPMITRAHIEGLSDGDCRPIDNPERFTEAGWYPTRYCSNNRGGEYSVSLEGFQWYPGLE